MLRELGRRNLLVIVLGISLLPLADSWSASPTGLPYCWRDLSGSLVKQNVDDLYGEPSVALSPNETLWLTWAEDDGIRVRYRDAGEWKAVPGPDGPLVSSHRPLIAIGAQERPFLLWGGNEQGQTNIFVAQWNGKGWEGLGASLSAYPEEFTHAGDAVMTLDGMGLPVVAWQEAKGNDSRSLHAVRWNGTEWIRLGEKPIAEGIDLYSLEPDLSIDHTGTIWVSWVAGTRERSYIRVARWKGEGWQEVSAGTLEQLTNGQDVRMPHLAIVDENAIFLAWFYRVRKDQSFLVVAQWDGVKWLAVPPPVSTVGAAKSVWSPSMAVGENRTVFLAWNEKDASGFYSVYVQKFRANKWEPVFSGVHLDSGNSDVSNPLIIRGGRQGFYLVWDERDSKQGHVRVIRADECAPGVNSSPFPPTVRIDSFWPKTVEAAVRDILEKLTPESRVTLLQTPRTELGKFNLTWGMAIRNAYGLWRGNPALLESCGDKQMEPDRCSMIIMIQVWDLLHGNDLTEAPNFNANER